jgi:hypothetical protein
MGDPTGVILFHDPARVQGIQKDGKLFTEDNEQRFLLEQGSLFPSNR